jgi:hypothetical protein
MAKWDSLTVPKKFGWLGILNTRRMNDCLLVKWIWRIVNREDSLWCRIMYKKYMHNKDFLHQRAKGAPSSGKGCIR